MDDYFKPWLLNLASVAKESGTSSAHLISWLLKGIGITTNIRFLDLKTLTFDQLQKIELGLARLLAHEPLSKILQEQEFYGRTFKTTHDTLDPRADSEILINAMLSYFPADTAPLLLDLGTGTGCLLITFLLERPHATGLAVDICPKALAVAKENAARHGVADRMQFLVSDWCADVSGVFDAVISNPPYIIYSYPLEPSVALYDPERALFAGIDGLDAYRTLFDQLHRLCTPTTKIAFEIGFDQSKSVPALAHKKDYFLLAEHKDKSGITRALIFEKKP